MSQENPMPAFSGLRVQVEVTTHCNVQCKMCIRPRMIKKIGAKHLPWPVFEKLVSQAPPNANFCLQGTGEPFLHPDFYRMTKACKKRGFYVETFTNGLVFDPEKVIDSGIDNLVVSLLGSDRANHDKRMRGGDFVRVIKNIEQLQKLKSDRNTQRPKLAFNVCVMNENLDEMSGVIDLAEKLGVETVMFTPVGDNPNLLPKFASWEKVRAKITEKIAQKSIRANFYDLPLGLNERFKSCTWPWGGYYVTVAGKIGPCCTRPHLKSAWLPGDVEKIDDMAALWHSRPYQEFRQALSTQKKETVPDMCRECVEYNVE
jgi:MoaA/NifB/PqqE/SkfB family radical SAM enzyme